MKPTNGRSFSPTLVAGLLLIAAAAAGQPHLTGMTQYAATSSGGIDNGWVWNTYGGGGVWNLYVTQGSPSAPFINTGDGAGASIDVALPVGTYTFSVVSAYPGPHRPYMALNLFFDGDGNTPRISVVAADNVPGGNAAIGTGYDLYGSTVANSGSLSWVDGLYRVTLSGYLYQDDTLSGIDRVSPFAAASDGTNDFIATFTLTVAEVEAIPAATRPGLALLALAVLLCGAAVLGLRRAV